MAPRPKTISPSVTKAKVHRAVQVFNFDDDGTITFNAEEVLPVLQQPHLLSKKVCVVSIAGALRQGKSFIINFFIRYLRFMSHKRFYENEKDWLRSEDAPISGFSWKPGSDRHTLGILMWSKVFLIKPPDADEEIAVIIMDTQGTFDNETTITQCTSIFALSVLLSSFQIYNLHQNIRQDDLSHLQLFSGYGRLMSESSELPPFQKLLFLVRDWQWTAEKIGFQGNDVLDGVLKKLEKSGKEELISLKGSITENFGNASCFLLPYPGEKVATNLDFSGNVEDIGPEFIKQVEKLVPEILAPAKLVPKTVNNEPITVEGFVDLIHVYWKNFKDGSSPTVYSAYSATAEVHHMITFREALATYKKLMLDCRSRREADKIKMQVLESFRSQKKLGTNVISQKYEADLNNEMDTVFSSDYKDLVQDAEVSSNIKKGVISMVTATTAVTGILAIAVEAKVSAILILCASAAAGSLGVGTGVGCAVWGGYKLVKWGVKRYKTSKQNAEIEDNSETEEDCGTEPEAEDGSTPESQTATM